MDVSAARCAALLAAAIARAGQRATPADLMADATPLIPWILVAATQTTLTLQGAPMPLTIDSVNSVAVLEFADRQNDKVAPPPGAIATATSSDPAVMTVGAGVAGTDANGIPVIQFPLSEVAEGTVTLSVHATAADGTSALMGPDGTTPIPDPDPVQVTVKPGAAAAEIFTVPGA